MPPTIFDRHGSEQPWSWLEERFGPLVIHPKNPGPGWVCTELHQNADLHGDTAAETILAPSVIRVHATGIAAEPVPNLQVAWYWPDAPENPEAGPIGGLPEGMRPGRADRPGLTNGAGDVDFAMGGGAYYAPPHIGPHAVWIYGAEVNSDVVLGLGMLAATNHESLWPAFQFVPGDEPPEPPRPIELAQALANLEAAIAAVREALT